MYREACDHNLTTATKEESRFENLLSFHRLHGLFPITKMFARQNTGVRPVRWLSQPLHRHWIKWALSKQRSRNAKESAGVLFDEANW